MLKLIIPAAAVSLAITTLNVPAYASHNLQFNDLPSIDSSVQSPQTRARVVRHTIRIQVPQNGKAISQLQFSIPSGLSVRNDVIIHDESKKELASNTSVNENTVTINFSQPVEPGTNLEIDMNQVVISRPSSNWLYRVTAKLVGFQPEMNLGVARIRGRLR
jgi:hypothetical protein